MWLRASFAFSRSMAVRHIVVTHMLFRPSYLRTSGRMSILTSDPAGMSVRKRRRDDARLPFDRDRTNRESGRSPDE